MADIEDITQGGFCSGCGACAVMSDRVMQLNPYGEYVPSATPLAGVENAVCPFLNPELNEDVLAGRFVDGRDHKTDELGFFNVIHAAHVIEGNFRADGSSGGMGSWLGAELLRKGLIDAVIHVKPACRTQADSPFFEYCISRSEDSLREGAHSHYHAVEISHVMQEVREVAGRYLFVGVPCFAKAVRRLQVYDDIIRDRIKYVASLICGHMKSVNWSLSLGWAVGMPPADMGSIQFRVKREGIPAKAYYYGVKGHATEDEFQVYDSASVTGGKFNLGAMMLNACNFCDDVVGETADITIGDAWLPQYAFDWRGKNMLIVRNCELAALLVSAETDGRVSLEPMRPSDAVKAQAGGFRQRREGLKYRVQKMENRGRWHPVKRLFTGVDWPRWYRRRIYDLRQKCSEKSRVLFLDAVQAYDFSVYDRGMFPLFKFLRTLELSLSIPEIILKRIRYYLMTLRVL